MTQPLPYGTRARLLLLHLCCEAIRQKSPTIDIEDSLTAFIRAIGYPGHRRQERHANRFKATDQRPRRLLTCASACGMASAPAPSAPHRSRQSGRVVSDQPRPAHAVASTITFSQTSSRRSEHHALPVNVAPSAYFANSRRASSICCSGSATA